MADIAPSASWQQGFYIACAIFLLYSAWRGWRRGVVRGIVVLLAIGVSYAMALAAGSLVATPLAKASGAPELLFSAPLGLLVGLATYVAVIFVGGLLFKRTDQQANGLVRLAYGAGGAITGILFGLIILWSSITAIRALGALAVARIESSRPGGQAPPAIAGSLARLKASIELGPSGEVVKKADILPDEAYGLITKVARLSGDPQAVARLASYPGFQDILSNPKIVALTADPDIVAAAQKGDFLSLLQNKRILETAGDPELAKILSGFQFEKALDYAIGKPQENQKP